MWIPGPELRWKGSWKISVDVLKSMSARLLARRDLKSGLIYGISAEQYAEGAVFSDRPIWRVAADGMVIEIKCSDAELYEILRELRPVDYIQMPEGKTWLFIFYADEAQAEVYARLFGVREDSAEQPALEKKYRSIDDPGENSESS